MSAANRDNRFNSDMASLDTEVAHSLGSTADVKVSVFGVNQPTYSASKSTCASTTNRKECPCCYCHNKPPKGANAYPLVMLAFGLSNIMLGSYNCRLVPFDAAGLSQGFMYAGVGQTLCGFFAFGNGNTIGAFFALTFGAWWYSLMTSIWLPMTSWGVGTLGMNGFWYNMVWALFLLLNLVVVLANGKKDIMNPLSMTCVTITSTSVAIQSALPSAIWALRVAGVACTISGCVGTYIGASAFLGEIYGRDLLPLGFGSSSSSSDQSMDDTKDSLPK